MRSDQLRELWAKLADACGPSRDLDFEIHRIGMDDWLDRHGYRRDGDAYITSTPPVAGGEEIAGPERLTSRLDAAVSFVERVLPYADWKVMRYGAPVGDPVYHALVGDHDHSEVYTSDSAPFALIYALLSALIDRATAETEAGL